MLSTFYRTLLRLGLFLVIFLGAPTIALAHERWFVPNWQQYPPQFGLLFTLPVLLCIALACGGVGILAGIRVLVGGDNRFPQVGFLRYYDRSNQIILAVQTAISLIAVAVSLSLFAPNLTVGRSAFGIVLVGAEVFVAFSFISGLITRVGALILIAVFLVFFAAPAWYTTCPTKTLNRIYYATYMRYCHMYDSWLFQ
ncbi:MAG: hypothetical protein H0V70_06130 [Ktedonobacteraceae bacterium]|nr:hypothetical protein [Ktedonobacteraceae bacterium]